MDPFREEFEVELFERAIPEVVSKVQAARPPVPDELGGQMPPQGGQMPPAGQPEPGQPQPEGQPQSPGGGGN